MRFGRVVAAVTAGMAAGLAAAGLMAAAGAPAEAAMSAHSYRLQVVAIDRYGQRVSTDPVVAGTSGALLSTSGQSVKLTPGRYLVGAAVQTPARGSAQLSYTLVAKQVTISGNETVTLDARRGRLLKVAFKAAGAQQLFQGAALCDGLPGGMLAGVYNDPTGTTYIAPVPKTVRLFYQSRWQSPTGTLYDLAGAGAAGGKAAPDFRDSISRLAKVRLQVRTGTSAGSGDGGLLLDHGANCEPFGDELASAAPFGATDYMQAGVWSAQVSVGARTLYWDGRFSAGRTYSLQLGAAVYGPWLAYIDGTLFPSVNGSSFADYAADSLFGDPVAGQVTSDCKVSVTSTLSTASRVLRRLRQNGCAQSGLTRKLTKSGWYYLRVTGTQSAELSTRVSLDWRFYVKTGPSRLESRALPVTLTELRPAGLSLANSAKPGADTTIEARILKAGYPDTKTPANVLKTIRIEASFDGGTTWQALRLTRHGGHWTVSVHDPASGFVALRSVVVNTKGDSTTETIYRAYAIG